MRTLRIWSAGCASGEEPYSIAMVLRQLLPDVDEWAITILATDVNTEALDRARKAVYGDWAFREERARQWRRRYFRPRGKRHELIPEVRRMVTFAQLNLTENSYPAYETNTTFMDMILCRNVMIYCQSLKDARDTADIPVIMFARHNGPEAIASGLQTDAVDYIPKDALVDAVLLERLRQMGLIVERET
ncbi:MAG: CheR family methyltransferase [Anaerolineae bacterium]